MSPKITILKNYFSQTFVIDLHVGAYFRRDDDLSGESR